MQNSRPSVIIFVHFGETKRLRGDAASFEVRSFCYGEGFAYCSEGLVFGLIFLQVQAART